MSKNIEDAILGLVDMDLAVNREVLKAAVMRQIMCPRSGVVLDLRTAVYFRVETALHQSAAECVDGAVWDDIAAKVTQLCAEKKITLEVIDGRVVNAPKPRRPRS